MRCCLLLLKCGIILKYQFILLRFFMLIIIVGACSARPPQSIIQQEFEFDGSIIQAQGDILTADELFEKGVNAFESQKFTACESYLTRYLENFPQGRYLYYTHYNLGLCYEFQHKYKLAAEQFEAYTILALQQKLTSDRIDGEVRQGYNLVYSGQGEKAISLYDTLLLKEKLIGFDRAECHLRRGMAYILLKRYAEADRDFSQTLGHINGNIGPHREGNEALAEVYFQRGELYRRHMNEVQLKMPLLRMRRQLMDKSRFFKKSLYSYVESIRIHNHYWATAAGHQLGILHEEMYYGILAAEAPNDFDQETLAYYFHEMDKKLAPLIRDSISIFERTITLSSSKGIFNLWVDATKIHLQRLRDLEGSIHKRLALDAVKAYELRKATPKRLVKSSPLFHPRGPQHETINQAEDELIEIR
jgi:tetratricopeptide (TPR) repeat protein